MRDSLGGRWRGVSPRQASPSYRAQCAATAVGTTSDLTGTIYLTEAGLAPDLVSSFQVDLRTLQSDQETPEIRTFPQSGHQVTQYSARIRGAARADQVGRCKITVCRRPDFSS